MSIGVERDISRSSEEPGVVGKAVMRAYSAAVPVGSYMKEVSGAVAGTRAWKAVRGPFKKFAEMRYYGHTALPYTDWTVDLYQSSGSMFHRQPDLEDVKRYLLADDMLTSESFEGTWLGGDLTVAEINEAYETIVEEYMGEDTVHLDADLPVTGKMGVAPVPLVFQDTVNGVNYPIGAGYDDKPYETGLDHAFQIDIPGFKEEDGDVLEGFMTVELHLEVPENVVNLDLRCLHEKQHIWRLTQYLALGEELADLTHRDMDDVFLGALHADEYELKQRERTAIQNGNTAISEQIQMEKSLSRLTKYFSYLVTQDEVARESRFNEYHMNDLEKGIEAMNDYTWIRSLDAVEDVRRAKRFLSTETGSRHALPLSRLEEEYSEDDILFRYVTEVPTYAELWDDAKNLDRTQLEDDVKWGRRRWIGEKLGGILPVSYLAGGEVHSGVTTVGNDVGQYVFEATASPVMADAAAISGEIGGLLLGGTAIVLGGSMAGTAAARGMETVYGEVDGKLRRERRRQLQETRFPAAIASDMTRGYTDPDELVERTLQRYADDADIQQLYGEDRELLKEDIEAVLDDHC